MPHTWTSTEGNGKRSSAAASVATVSHGVELTQCSEGESGFPGCSEGTEFGCNAGDPGSIPGWGRSLEKGMATYSSILAWRIPWTEEPGELQSIQLERVRHD